MALLPDRDELTTPADGDLYVTTDVSDTTDAATGTDKKITWANIKAALKTYFDTLYAAALGADDNYVTDAEKTLISGITASAAEINTLDGITASTAELNILDGVTATAAEINHIDGVTSAIQTQLDGKLSDSGDTLNGAYPLAENASIDLDPALSADGKYSGICITGTAGATLAFGDLVYLAAADSRWELADADAATTADRLLGMCVLAAASDGDATKILLQGNIRADAAFPALTIGSPAYVGETAGDIQTAIPTGADNVIRRVGYALTADALYFNPSMDAQTTVA